MNVTAPEEVRYGSEHNADSFQSKNFERYDGTS